MNQNKRVLHFTLSAVFILFIASVFSELFADKIPVLRKVSLLSDVFHEKEKKETPQEATGIAATNLPAGDPRITNFSEYIAPKKIIRFESDKTAPALPAFTQKLAALKKGEKKKIRIAWFGDSMIEGDLLTQTFRKKMQGYFGGQGVGFVPFRSVSSDIRQSVRAKASGSWEEENLKTQHLSSYLHLCGHSFYTNDGELQLKDLTITDTAAPMEKSLICGHSDSDIDIAVNGRPLRIAPKYQLNRITLDNSSSASIDVAIKNKTLPVYGISVEPVQGVVVDNFSFRGITGIELGKLDSSFLQSLAQNNPYDLIVLEYGTNLLFRPNDNNYSYYFKKMKPVLQYLKRLMPDTEFLLISSADRAFKYDEQWKTAVGLDSLLATQARLAYENKMAFYNMYSSMGGKGTIVRWADSTVSYANKDYIHPNHKGAELLGNILFDAFIEDYKKLKPAVN